MVGSEQSLKISALMVWDRQYLEDSELKDHSIYQSMNHEGVYRAAPATPDLLTSDYI